LFVVIVGPPWLIRLPEPCTFGAPIGRTRPDTWLGIEGETADAEPETSAAAMASAPSSVANASKRFMEVLS